MGGSRRRRSLTTIGIVAIVMVALALSAVAAVSDRGSVAALGGAAGRALGRRASAPPPDGTSGSSVRIPVVPRSRVRLEDGRFIIRRGRYVTPREVLSEVGPLPSGRQASVHIIRVDGIERYYLEVAPRSTRGLAAHSLPVYVVLHGHHTDPAEMERWTALPKLSGPDVLIYPAGLGESWNAGGCCWYAHAHHIDDVAFIAAVVHQVLAIDPTASGSRVYAVGFSNGGRMTYRLACDLPGTFTGMAAVEAVPVMACPRLHALDIEIVARARDPLLRFGRQLRLRIDGYLEPTVTSSVITWKNLDGCVGPPTKRYEGTTLLTTWTHCREGTHVQFVLYDGAGHLWTWSRPPNPSATDLVLSQLGGDLRPQSGSPERSKQTATRV